MTVYPGYRERARALQNMHDQLSSAQLTAIQRRHEPLTRDGLSWRVDEAGDAIVRQAGNDFVIHRDGEIIALHPTEAITGGRGRGA